MATESMGFTAAVQASLDAVFLNGNWLATCVLSLIISAVMSSLAWMISTAFQSNELKGWAKKELSEFIFTGALIAVAYSLILTITYLTTAYVGGNPYSLAKDFLDLAQADLIDAYAHVTSLKTLITFISTFELKIGWITALLSIAGLNLATLLGSFGAILSNLTLSYGSPFSMVIGPLGSLESFMQPMFFAMFVQHELLNIIQKTMLPLVLPLGILLRAFPLTRRTGSTLIAISLAAYIIYPVSLVASSAMYSQMKSTVGTLGDIPNFDPTGQGLYVKTSPAPGKYYLNESDKFEWKALVPLNYSVWASINCAKTAGQVFVHKFGGAVSQFSELPPEQYVYWKLVNETPEVTYDAQGLPYNTYRLDRCFSRVNHGSVSSGENITRDLAISTLEKDGPNSVILIVKSEEKSITYVDENGFFFGDPCKESLWSRFYCWLSASTKEDELNDISYMRLGAAGIKGAFSGLGTFSKGMLSTASEASLAGAALSPVAAGYLFLYLTDNLDAIMFPPLMILFTFALTIAVFVSSFKSISQTLGGETKIVEMGRLI